MTATIHQLAPTSGRASSTITGAPAAAGGEAARAARSAQSNLHMMAAVKVMTDHARLVALREAGRDASRFGGLLKQQGEILLLAGMKLLAEGGAE